MSSLYVMLLFLFLSFSFSSPSFPFTSSLHFRSVHVALISFVPFHFSFHVFDLASFPFIVHFILLHPPFPLHFHFSFPVTSRLHFVSLYSLHFHLIFFSAKYLHSQSFALKPLHCPSSPFLCMIEENVNKNRRATCKHACLSWSAFR